MMHRLAHGIEDADIHIIATDADRLAQAPVDMLQMSSGWPILHRDRTLRDNTDQQEAMVAIESTTYLFSRPAISIYHADGDCLWQVAGTVLRDCIGLA